MVYAAQDGHGEDWPSAGLKRRCIGDLLRQQYQEESIGPGTRWALHLSAKDDQLLAKQRVFDDELGLGASEIGESSCQEGSAHWPRPVQ
jgi:hypothetical protein